MRHLALLRGVNVGGARALPMRDLESAFRAGGASASDRHPKRQCRVRIDHPEIPARRPRLRSRRISASRRRSPRSAILVGRAPRSGVALCGSSQRAIEATFARLANRPRHARTRNGSRSTTHVRHSAVSGCELRTSLCPADREPDRATRVRSPAQSPPQPAICTDHACVGRTGEIRTFRTDKPAEIDASVRSTSGKMLIQVQ